MSEMLRTGFDLHYMQYWYFAGTLELVPLQCRAPADTLDPQPEASAVRRRLSKRTCMHR